MELDPLAIRNLLIWIALAVGSTIFLGATPSWMRCAAKSADPSAAAAMFALVLAGALTAMLAANGALAPLMALEKEQYLYLALGGLFSALTWLCLFTALTGGYVSKVVPVYALWYVISLVASHFLFGTVMGLWKICCIVGVLLGLVFIESDMKNIGGRPGLFYALLAAFSAAGTALVKSGMPGAALDGALFQAGRSVAACVILWAFVFARGKQRTLGDLNARGWVGVSFAGLSLAASYACDYYAALRGEISYLAPIGILAFLFVMLFARMFQKEKQAGSVVFGTLLVLLGQFGILMGF